MTATKIDRPSNCCQNPQNHYYCIAMSFDSEPQLSETSDPCEDAQKRLESVKRDLVQCVRKANAEISFLKQRRDDGTKRLDAANKRYERVKKVSESMCDDCWDCLPSLVGIQIDTELSTNGLHCFSCGTPIYAFRVDRPQLPPVGMMSLRLSSDCRKYGEGVVEGTLSTTYDKWKSLRSHNNTNHLFGPSSNQNVYRQNESAQTWSSYDANIVKFPVKNTVAKAAYLSKALCLVEKEMKFLVELNYAIPHWEAYRAQHKVELENVKASLLKLKDHHQKSLESKLAALGENASGVSSNCVICLENPKTIVFQCGHQCCSSCSDLIVNCHSCRQLIVQRIRLHA
mmetsp:Transcript_22123/g.33437  ORF Transcript_22123/g.33437 Transcript_22123/m.33437 type:complete len:342 (+) Transcript_22123:3-1028(+)